MRFCISLAAIVACAGVAGSAWAKKVDDFASCDGIEKPSEKADGMTETSFAGVKFASHDFMRRPIEASGAIAVAACDRALADPRLLPAFYLRRAHLLQFRAAHLIDAGRSEESMTALDEADRLLANEKDPYFPQGLQLSGMIVRGLALGRLGRKSEALALADVVEVRRPWSRTNRDFAGRVRFAADESVEARFAQLRHQAPLDPGAALEGFLTAIRLARFPEALEFGAGLQFETPPQEGGWVPSGGANASFDSIPLRAELAGLHAYAFAASGKVQEASARIAAARALLLRETETPPPPPGQPLTPSGNDKKLATARTNAEASLAAWEALITGRTTVASAKTMADVRAMLQAHPRQSAYVLLDFVSQATGLEGQEATLRDAAFIELRKREDAIRKASAGMQMRQVVNELPQPEGAQRVIKYQRVSKDIFSLHSGFSSAPLDREGEVGIYYMDLSATMQSAEEAALYSASRLAREQGYDRLLLTSFRSVERINILSTGIRSYQGMQSQVRVQFVHGQAVPEAYRGAEWRLIDPAAVVSALAQKFPDPVAAAK